jgi:hypothetical protein
MEAPSRWPHASATRRLATTVKLASAEGKAIYARRMCVVEPAFGARSSR